MLFKECFECAAKPGSPILCPQCLWARENWPKAINKFKVREQSECTHEYWTYKSDKGETFKKCRECDKPFEIVSKKAKLVDGKYVALEDIRVGNPIEVVLSDTEPESEQCFSSHHIIKDGKHECHEPSTTKGKDQSDWEPDFSEWWNQDLKPMNGYGRYFDEIDLYIRQSRREAVEEEHDRLMTLFRKHAHKDTPCPDRKRLAWEISKKRETDHIKCGCCSPYVWNEVLGIINKEQ